MSDELRHALEVIHRSVEEDGSEIIYLHENPDAPSYGMLLRGKTKDRVEELLTGVMGEHSHLSGDEDDWKGERGWFERALIWLGVRAE
jgi:hypothetical protein